MKILPILLSLLLISLAQATHKFTRISKPKIFYVQTFNTKNLYTFLRKTPEERRKLTIFPRSYKKFVITLEPYHKVVNSIVHSTRKPIMRKLMIQDTIKMRSEFETERPKTQQILDSNVVKENSTGSVKVRSKKAFKEHNNSLKDDVIINQGSVPGGSIGKRIVDANRKEYVLDNPLQKDMTTIKPLEGFVTPQVRVKRSDNIIEEENLGTTVSGYKYTWRDTKLTNNLVFKNINS